MVALIGTTKSIIDFTKQSDGDYVVGDMMKTIKDDIVEKSSNSFKYNNHTRTPIIQRSKNNLRKKKAQKLARRMNRKK